MYLSKCLWEIAVECIHTYVRTYIHTCTTDSQGFKAHKHGSIVEWHAYIHIYVRTYIHTQAEYCGTI